MNKEIMMLIIKIIGLIGGIGGYVWLFIYEWKLAVALFFIIWSNNLSQKS